MRRLVDGAFAVVAAGERNSHVFSLKNPRIMPLGPEHAEELQRLAHGLEDNAPEGEAFKKLRSVGLAQAGLPSVDPDVEERLAQLGKGFAWHARGCPGGESLTALLRRLHARRKMSLFDLGQTAVLPECGVARCWQLTQRMGPRKRVLIIGDDDLLSIVLARMGHHVTVLDIDPVLIDFLKRAAAEEGVTINARVQDVLAPMPQDQVGRFDVVLTDPMSFESCLVAFLSRATSALKVGGVVFTCVHPLARLIFQRVVRRLPVHVEDVMNELSVYYYQGFVENWYRSDLYMLRRNPGPDPFAPSETIPFSDIIAGQLHDRHHSFTDIKSLPFSRPTLTDVQAALRQWEEFIGHAKVLLGTSHETPRFAHEFRILVDGGHLSLVLDKQKGVISWDLFPYQERWDQALVTAFQQVIRNGGVLRFHAIALDLATPPVIPDGVKKVARKKARAVKKPVVKKTALKKTGARKRRG